MVFELRTEISRIHEIQGVQHLHGTLGKATKQEASERLAGLETIVGSIQLRVLLEEGNQQTFLYSHLLNVGSYWRNKSVIVLCYDNSNLDVQFGHMARCSHDRRCGHPRAFGLISVHNYLCVRDPGFKSQSSHPVQLFGSLYSFLDSLYRLSRQPSQ